MRILILNHNTEGKGTYFRCYWFAKYLSKFGHRVSLFCLQKEKTLKISTKEKDGVKIILLPRIADAGLKELPAHIFRMLVITLYGLFKNFDVIHAFNVASPTTGLSVIPFWIFKKIGFKRYRIVIDWDDWWGKGGLTTLSNQGKLIEEVATLLEEKIPPLADKVTVVGDVLYKRAISVGVKTENLIKIGNGSNIDYIKVLNKDKMRKKLGLEDEFMFCFVGHILINFEFLLKALKDVKKKAKKSFKIIIIAPLKDEHFKLIDEYGLRREIIFRGVVSYDKMLDYLGASDVLLLPRSENILDKCEFPARLGDYMASGRAILANSVGEIESLILDSKGGLLAEAGDFLGFSKNALKLMLNSRLCEKLGKKGRLFAENKFSWSILAKRLIKEVYI